MQVNEIVFFVSAAAHVRGKPSAFRHRIHYGADGTDRPRGVLYGVRDVWRQKPETKPQDTWTRTPSFI